MKSISEAWINSHMKVRFLGLWKMYFFRILIKIFTVCTMGKTNTFDSMLNFIKLQWQKSHLFLDTLFFPSSLRKRHINDALQEYITNLIFSNFILSKIFFNSKIITCYSKKLERPRFGGWTICGILQKCWISCKTWLLWLKLRCRWVL